MSLKQADCALGNVAACRSEASWRDYHSWRAYSTLKAYTIKTFDAGGIFHLLRFAHRHRLLVLTYHDVLPGPLETANPLYGMTVDTLTLRAQMRELRRTHAPVSLSAVLAWLLDGAALPECPALVTFDDGHRNILDHAVPILEEFGIPAVVFVTAGFLAERQRLTWYEELSHLVMSARANVLHVDSAVLGLESEAAKVAACGALIDHLRQLHEPNTSALLEDVRRQLGSRSEAPLDEGRFSWLSADDCRELRRRGVEIGAHSVSHPILSTLDAAAAKSEIEGSKAILESHLGVPIEVLAYPFGEPGMDFGGREVAIAKAAGFRAAFAASGGLVRRNSNPWALPRVGMGQIELSAFRFATSGTLHTLRGR